MITFSPLIRNLQGSRISAITDLVAKLKRDGRSLCDFSMGQPDFVTPQYICDAAKAAIDRGDTGYTPTTGTFSLKQAICEKYLRDNGLHFEPANIAIGSGAKPLITDILRTLAGPGDEIIVKSERGAHFMLFGGESIGSKRYIWWNFVSSSRERIEQAKQEWRSGRFDIVPGDEEEFIPLPQN